MLVKVGIIGTGIVSDARAQGYLTHQSAKIVAVCDLNEKLAKEKAEMWEVRKVYTDYRDLLNDQEVNTVEILLPHALHAPVAIAAANAGKHVIVQKPMAMSPSEADAMMKAARDNRVKLGVCENYIRYPPIEKAAELIRAGEIGTPVIIRIEKVAGRGGPEQWREPDDPNDWRRQKEKHGGYLFDEIVHQWAVARALMMSDVETVSATFENIEKADERPGAVIWKHKDQNKYGSITYSLSRAKTNIQIRTDYYPVHEGYEVIGEKGILWITRCTGQLLNDPPLIVYRDGRRSTWENIEMDWGISFRKDVHNFVDDMMNGRDPRFSGADGKRGIQFALAVYKATRERREVSLDEIN